MKVISFLFLCMVLFSFTNHNKNNTNSIAEKQKKVSCEYYQLKTYLFENQEQVKTTENYLKNALLPALKRQSINNVGVFKFRPNEKDSTLKLMMLIPSTSLEKLLNVEKSLEKDETYLKAGAEYLNAMYNKPPFSRIESSLMKAFDGMPIMKAPKFETKRSDRVYELRSYESATEAYYQLKVEMFNGGEIALFEKLGFNAVFYGKVIAGNKTPNLMYMTTFSDQESRKQHWDTFVNSPDWNAMKAIPKYENTVSHVDIMFLYPTEYSDY